MHKKTASWRYGMVLFALAGCASNPRERGVKLATLIAPEKPKLASSDSRTSVRLAFSTRLMGQAAECGCAVNPKGGVDRRLNWMRSESAQGPVVALDAGNSLFPSEHIDNASAERLLAAAKLIARGQSLAHVVAQNVGFLDLAAGPDFLRRLSQETGLQWVSTNLLDAQKQNPFPPRQTIDLGGGTSLVVFGLTAGGTSLPEGWSAANPVTTLKAALQNVPATQPVVVLSDLGRTADEALARAIARPLVIVGSRDLSNLELPLHVGPSVIFQPAIQGAQWGLATLAYSKTTPAVGFYSHDLATRYEAAWKQAREEHGGTAADNDFRVYAATPKLDDVVLYGYAATDLTAEWATENELTRDARQFSPGGSSRR